MVDSHAVVTPIGPHIGALVTNMDLTRELRAEEAGLLRGALRDHHVLFFRDQHLPPVAIRRFAELFGPLLPHRRGDAQCPQVMPFRSKQAPDFLLGTEWHTDQSYTEHPPLGSLLYFTAAPAVGAELAYTNMHAALEALSPRMIEYLSGLSATHDATRSRFGSDRGVTTSWSHPLVSTHAVTGRRLLYFNCIYTTKINDVPAPESRAMVRFLSTHVANPYFHIRIKVEANSLVLWDNRCTQHLALWNFEPGSLAGHRAQVESVCVSGDRC